MGQRLGLLPVLPRPVRPSRSPRVRLARGDLQDRRLGRRIVQRRRLAPRGRQAAHQRWLADARHTLGYARGAYAGRGRLTETAGAIALAFAQGAHATLAARGEWITNEKALLEQAGFRRADEVLGGLTADPPSLVAAVDAASDLIGETAG